MRAKHTLEELLAAYREHGSYRKAAGALGYVNHDAVRWRLKHAAAHGDIGFEPVLPGFEVKETSAKIDGVWVRQARERGPEFQTPAGHVVKGVSALVDGEGRTIQQWVKTREDDVVPGLVDALEKRFAETAAPLIPSLECQLDVDLMEVYPIADQHFGMLAWGRETGDAYDMKIGAARLRDCAARLISQAPAAETALILNLGDFFHADDTRNTTPEHGYTLDVDSRYFKIVEAGVALLVDVIELALQRHGRIVVKNLPGNHDPHAYVVLTIALKERYRAEPRVIVDAEPGDFFYRRFGNVFIGATHGHKTKPDRMVMDMAVTRRADWAACDYRYFYFGHIHHESAIEVGDVRVESFQTIASKDAFNHSHGFNAGRALVGITLHARDGEIGRHRVNLPQPMKKVTS